ncbi:YeiH family protein [Celeribacter sp.]|uniref:YeiH family protein n=1 Tax=Celeribacter sp. TaxID=1890673 RepID=UPI003A9503ED
MTVSRARALGPGLLIVALVAMAAQFVADHYGAPVMLMAILFGIPLHFLMYDGKCAEGIDFAARHILRFGVALLGLRVSFDMVQAIGWAQVGTISLGVAATILLSVVLAPLVGKDRLFGFLTGGAVAICGASAAMAINSILPKTEESERNLSFTVISVTVLSTVAMIVYPIVAQFLGLSSQATGVFFGGTIHDVAQVVGAGYSVSEETGDVATVVKLFRVTLLAPVVFIGALILRRTATQSEGRPPLLPLFVVGFLILAALNSYHLVPSIVTDGAGRVSRVALVIAVAAVGMKTSLEKLRYVGREAIFMLVAQTIFLGVFVLVTLSA